MVGLIVTASIGALTAATGVFECKALLTTVAASDSASSDGGHSFAAYASSKRLLRN